MSNEGFGGAMPPRRQALRATDPAMRRGRFLPAVLDALFPGLGHVAAGRRV